VLSARDAGCRRCGGDGPRDGVGDLPVEDARDDVLGERSSVGITDA
jgi:hypothetical protein